MRAFILLLMLCGSAHAVEVIEWDKSVIELELIVGVDHRIDFGAPVHIGLRGVLKDQNIFEHMANNGTAYWRALAPFGTHRLKARVGSNIVLFDLKAVWKDKPPKAVPMVKILMDEQTTEPVKQSAESDTTMFDLLRYAMQQDYTIPSALKPIAGVREAPTIKKELSALYSAPEAICIDVFVKHAWQLSGYYVTALSIHNRTSMTFRIRPEWFQHTSGSRVNSFENRFLMAGMIHHAMDVKGSKYDETMIYIVTDKPFETVVQLENAQ